MNTSDSSPTPLRDLLVQARDHATAMGGDGADESAGLARLDEAVRHLRDISILNCGPNLPVYSGMTNDSAMAALAALVGNPDRCPSCGRPLPEERHGWVCPACSYGKVRKP